MKDIILKELLQVALDNKAYDICYANISKINPLAEYYIILTVDSNRQAMAIAKYSDEVLAKHDIIIKHIEGNATSEWILVDGIDYIIHIFVKDARNKYSLEKILTDCEIIKVD